MIRSQNFQHIQNRPKNKEWKVIFSGELSDTLKIKSIVRQDISSSNQLCLGKVHHWKENSVKRKTQNIYIEAKNGKMGIDCLAFTHNIATLSEEIVITLNQVIVIILVTS